MSSMNKNPKDNKKKSVTKKPIMNLEEKNELGNPVKSIIYDPIVNRIALLTKELGGKTNE